MAVIRIDWTTDAVEVGWTPTMNTAVDHQRNLVVSALSDEQPVLFWSLQ